MIQSAAILTIGDELLIGQVLDTNATWLSSKLTEVGVHVRQRMSCSDNIDEIKFCLNTLAEKNDLIITTGGLGPTDDDKTVDALCSYLGVHRKQDPQSVERITSRLQSFLKHEVSDELLSLNLRQADIPSNAKALDNPQGAAPGIYAEQNSTHFISLPGVPFEVRAITEAHIIPMLRMMVDTHISLYNIVVYNIAESKLHLLLRDFENALDEHTKLAYLPQTSHIVLRLTRRGDAQGFEQLCQKLKITTAEYFLMEGDNILGEVIHLLQQKKLKITTAESCTGGGLASMICDVPGASSVFHESLVSYENSVKIEKLGVPTEVISNHGAVSEETVKAMAKGQLNNTDANLSIAISGILGPTGGSLDKPVGTTYIALTSPDHLVVKKIKGRWTRSINKSFVIDHALIMTLQYLQD